MTERCRTCLNCVSIADAERLMPCQTFAEDECVSEDHGSPAVICELRSCLHPKNDSAGCECACHEENQ